VFRYSLAVKVFPTPGGPLLYLSGKEKRIHDGRDIHKSTISPPSFSSHEVIEHAVRDSSRLRLCKGDNNFFILIGIFKQSGGDKDHFMSPISATANSTMHKVSFIACV
jgi:hypothetical protein